MSFSQDPRLNSAPVTPFGSTGVPLYSNNPSNVSYGSLYDNGNRMANRAPLPPPRNQNYGYSSYSNPLSTGYNRYPTQYNRPMFNSYSPYYQSSYMNPMQGPVSSFEPSFINEAQESSREAFASIESIVHAFGSINMMIESTYCALQSSFNAVLSVAENFSRLKSQFGQVLSAFTFIRTFQWLYRKLLYLIGLRSIDPTKESAWKSAARSVEDPALGNSARKSSWPVIMFFIAVYAGPFLMWKFINSLMQRGKTKESWVMDNGDYYYAIAKYSYDAQSPEELSFSAGDCLKLAPYDKQTDKSWPIASNGKRTGVIPVNYVDIKLKSAQSQPPVKTPVANSVPVTRPQHTHMPQHTHIPQHTHMPQHTHIPQHTPMPQQTPMDIQAPPTSLPSVHETSTTKTELVSNKPNSETTLVLETPDVNENGTKISHIEGEN